MDVDPKVIAIAGAGPGNGAALARRFAREGYAVALLARSATFLDSLAEEIARHGGKALSLPVDLTSAAQVADAFGAIEDTLGDVTVLVQNAALMHRGPFLELDPSQFEEVFRLSVMGMVNCCRAALPGMQLRRRGNVVVVGATGSLRGSPDFAPFAVGKFGQRALAQSLAREFGPQGIHVSHVVIDGAISNERTLHRMPGKDPGEFLNPDHIAEAIWHLVQQPASAWTHELDLRPFGEKF